MLASLISKAQKIFQQKPDQDDLKQTQNQIEELTDINILMEGNGGKVLINWLKTEVKNTIDNIIKTKEVRFISDLESQLKLFNKLTSSKDELKLIEDWLSEEINKYEQE